MTAHTPIVALLMAVTAVAHADSHTMSPDPAAFVAPSWACETLHTALDLAVDMEHHTIAGSVTHTMRSLRPSVDEIRFNCVDLTVDSVTVDERPVSFEYPVPGDRNTSWLADTRETIADDMLVIHLGRTLTRGEEARVAVFYHGAPKIGLYWIPTEKGIPEQRLEVWSQGEGENNRYWIPCHDYPNGRATFEGRFRVPKGYTAISNGALVETRDVGDRTEFVWKLDHTQASYLIMLAVAKYKIYKDTWHDVGVWYVVPPDTDDNTILRGLGLTPDMIDFFSKETGVDYPFAKYAQIIVQDFVYGGMENTSATVENMRTLYDEREALTRTAQNLVAHELAHQWFGDLLTCREWPDVWLNEGFATYYCYLYMQHHDGEDAFRYQMRDAQRQVVTSDDADPRPMVVDFFNRRDVRNNTNVYNRGASVLHMLRFLLGDDVYRTVIHEYTTRNAYSTVDTRDLMSAVRDVSGENLDWFFEQWVYMAGYPKFQVSKHWNGETGVLEMHVAQTQKVDGLVPLFRVPLDVEIAWEGGSRVQRIVVDKASQDFYFPVPSEPKMVIFDKGEWIPKTLDFPKPVGELRYELNHADFIARVRAVEMLGKDGSDPRAVEALRDVLSSDQYWGIRREAALALGATGTPAARDALIQGLSLKEARVRLACAEALGHYYRDDTAATALERAIDSDRAYGVRARAVTSLVQTREERTQKVCVAAIEQDSDRSSVRNAAFAGLAELGDPSVIDRIRPWCAPGHRRAARHAAIKAFASLASTYEADSERRKAADYLVPFLNDWYLRTREAVIDALATIADPVAVSPLRRMASNDPVAAVRDRARVAANRIEAHNARSLARDATAAELKALQQRVDALEKEMGRRHKADPGKPSDAATDG